jgi:predicted ATP-grasp superfamily ATP-dependent carboligase
MNLLITNAQEFQAYAIACSLRSEADKIVITEGGDSVASTGFRGLVAYSRFVDARHEVPHFANDWLAGRLEDANTEAEEAYIQRIEDICAREHIDVIFPSLDPEVYLFAKNKKRLLNRGILTVVPEPEVVRVPMDKALTIQAAERIGFPCPKTFFSVSEADIDRILQESTPPWIVKPRFTAHGAHMLYVAEPSGLRAAVHDVSVRQELPIVQEYLTGGKRRNYFMMVGRDSEILSLLSPVMVRGYRSGFKVSNRSMVSASSGPLLAEVRALVRHLRLWGAYGIQTQIDPRDGVPKLLEINPRFGHHLWCRTGLGVNEPLIFLQLARGERPSGTFQFPEGVALLDPINDFFYLCNQAVAMLAPPVRLVLGRGRGAQTEALDVNPQGVLETLRAYRPDYLSTRPKTFTPESRNLFRDPAPCIHYFWFKLKGMVRSWVSYLGSPDVRT